MEGYVAEAHASAVLAEAQASVQGASQRLARQAGAGMQPPQQQQQPSECSRLGSSSSRYHATHLACERDDCGRCTSITACSGTTSGLQLGGLAVGMAEMWCARPPEAQEVRHRPPDAKEQTEQHCVCVCVFQTRSQKGHLVVVVGVGVVFNPSRRT